MEEINKAVTDGFTAEEVEAAKSGWLQQRTVSRAQDAGLATAISNSLFLNRTLAWDEKVEKEVAGLTAEKINAAMKKHLDPAKINIVKAGDFAKAKAEEKK
jgi:zinc protease